MKLTRMHHVAVICSDYHKSRDFYVGILGLEVLAEVFREDRNSYKLDLGLGGNYVLELFSFPDPPPRASYPEAAGLRHLAFETADIERTVASLSAKNVKCEPLRTDEFTGKRFTFISDPDGLPIEFYEK